MIPCDCHRRKHREENLTTIMRPDYMNGDPAPAVAGAALYLCARGLRERERRMRALERARRAHDRSKAA